METAALLREAGAEVKLRIDLGTEHITTDEACATATELLTTAAAHVSGRRV
ncbi:hypothetical protein [Amycolatopsis vastitatis]|uniref:hypothetical protein n=1 Tax=Amycolatopsis vastitatis TaxID=1905142 RepID=UPI0013045276|nr:hypothetical protein [Amycolatopsis vastitatis]